MTGPNNKPPISQGKTTSAAEDTSHRSRSDQDQEAMLPFRFAILRVINKLGCDEEEAIKLLVEAVKAESIIATIDIYGVRPWNTNTQWSYSTAKYDPLTLDTYLSELAPLMLSEATVEKADDARGRANQRRTGRPPEPFWAEVVGWVHGWLCDHGPSLDQADDDETAVSRLVAVLEARAGELGKTPEKETLRKYAVGLWRGFKAYQSQPTAKRRGE
jgi:hypothetical protein